MDSNRFETIRYEDLELRLRTGDILLFHGVSRRSRIIEDVTRNEFLHIGMIVRSEAAKAPLLWQSDPRAVTQDVRDHRGAWRRAIKRTGRGAGGDDQRGIRRHPFVRQLIVERTADIEQAALQATAAIAHSQLGGSPWEGGQWAQCRVTPPKAARTNIGVE